METIVKYFSGIDQELRRRRGLVTATLVFAGVILLLALLMQYLGSAPVKGFSAVVAIVSALACLLTMLVTRPLAMCAVDKKPAAGK